MTDPKDSSDPIPLTPSGPLASPSETPSPAPAASADACSTAPLDFGGPLRSLERRLREFPRRARAGTVGASSHPDSHGRTIGRAEQRPCRSVRSSSPRALNGRSPSPAAVPHSSSPPASAVSMASSRGPTASKSPSPSGWSCSFAASDDAPLRRLPRRRAALFHMVDRRPLGDLRALASADAHDQFGRALSRVFPIDIAFLKQTYDVIAPIAVAWAMILALFRLNLRDAATVLGAAILSLIILGFGSTIVSFAIWRGSAAATT